MRPLLSFLTALSLLACSSSNSPSRPQGQSSAPISATKSSVEIPSSSLDNDLPEKNTEAARECLPVVAAECGCVYSCGLGVRQNDGRYKVRHEFWKDTELDAHIAQWCVGVDCTNAFHAEIVCSGICERKAADPSCGFVDGRCIGDDKPD